MTFETTTPKQRAVLVAVQLPGVSDEEFQSSLAELHRLVDTYGATVVGTVTQKRPTLSPASVIGEGKLDELTEWTETPPQVSPDDPVEEPKADLIVVDHEISPSQLRNLESATGAEALDRSGIIVEIFHRHAKSREAKLQVELARLAYTAPRLRESGKKADRQRGGIGGKGAGESALELDRRKIRDRMAELRQELESIAKEQSSRRSRRKEQSRVALVGYTNAGKSSLMRALTKSEVLVQDKLFATLDTTVRVLSPETHPPILVSDTVGFIKKLPHDLVASFRSTLDEALEASLLLYVADASDPTFRSQLSVTQDVLREIGAHDIPSYLVLNKIDRVNEEDQGSLRLEFPDAILLSAKNPNDITMLHGKIRAFFERNMLTETLFIPHNKLKLLGVLHSQARVLSEQYNDEGLEVSVRAEPAVMAKIKQALTAEN